jgi:hypothetical protein
MSTTYLAAHHAYEYWANNGAFPEDADLKPHNNFQQWLNHPDHINIFTKPHLQKNLTAALTFKRTKNFSASVAACAIICSMLHLWW